MKFELITAHEMEYKRTIDSPWLTPISGTLFLSVDDFISYHKKNYPHVQARIKKSYGIMMPVKE